MTLDDEKTGYALSEGWLTSDVRPKKGKPGKKKGKKKRLPLGFRPSGKKT